MHKSSLVLLILSGVLVLFSSSGCTKSGTEEKDDHLEHHVPEHYPASYSDAVHGLMSRFADWKKSGKIESGKLSQLRDIVNWLPEIAADTELKKPEWDKVNSIHKNIRILISTLDQDPSQQSTWKTIEVELEELHELEYLSTHKQDSNESSGNHKDEHDHHHEVKK